MIRHFFELIGGCRDGAAISASHCFLTKKRLPSVEFAPCLLQRPLRSGIKQGSFGVRHFANFRGEKLSPPEILTASTGPGGFPQMDRAVVYDRLVDMICNHPNPNVRKAAETFLDFELSEMADELIELAEISPQFSQAIIEQRIGDAQEIAWLLTRSIWSRPVIPAWEAEDLIMRARILSQFSRVQSAASPWSKASTARGLISPLVKLAMPCVTVAESIERHDEVSWNETPEWFEDEGGEHCPSRQSRLRFHQIFTFYRSVFVADRKAKKVVIEKDYSPDCVAYLADLAVGDARPNRYIVDAMKLLASEGRFGSSF